MVKVYEIKGMDKCKMSTTYLGVKVNLEFKGGDIMSRKDGCISTANPFIQAAIEAMPSYGHKIVLKREIDDAPVETVVTEEAPTRPRATKVKAFGADKKKAAATDGSTIVDEVKNINDAASYFMEKGEAVESKEQLEEFMQKYNVVFPNMK
jgi:hypothetical protein